MAQVELTGDPIRLNLDRADGWPRYYFALPCAQIEIEMWLRKRKQYVEGKSIWRGPYSLDQK